MRLFAIVLLLSITGVTIFGNANVSAAEKSDNKHKSKVVLVKKGDTLTKIAKKNDTTYKRLFNANKNITNPDLIYPGDKIRIPQKDEKLENRFSSLFTTRAVDFNHRIQKAPSKASYSTSNSTTVASYSGGVWDKLAACESGGNWSINTGNGYYGGLQFSQGSWSAVGGSGSPANASKAEQIKRAKMLQARQGWGAWPACSAKLGLR